MKKGIIVLLITVLAAGMVFAADPTLSGSFNTTFGYDFDGNHDYGFNAEGKRAAITTEFKFSFSTVSVTKGSKGENLPYAEVEATASVTADDIVLGLGRSGKDDVEQADYTFKLKLKASITKANIVGNGWTIDLLGAKAGSDYAKAVIDLRKHSDKKYYALDFIYAYDKADGVTVKFDNYGTIAVGITGDKDKTNASVFVETADDLLKFNDFALKFAGTFTTKEGDHKLGASAKASYGTDMLSAGVAADFGYDNKQFNTDVAANVAYKQESFDFTFDAYYATYAQAKAKDDVVATEVNYLGAKAVVDIKDIKTDVTVEAYDLLDDPEDLAGGVKGKKTLNVKAHNTYIDGVEITVSGLDLINDARDVSVEATTTLIENLTLSVFGKELINKQDLGLDAVYTGIENFTISAGAQYTIASKELAAYGQVSYAADLFTAYARADFAKVIDDEGANLGLSAGIETTKLVDNATLSLVWAALDNDGHTTNDVLNKSYGAIVAGCKIVF